jgi:hypothetical protein
MTQSTEIGRQIRAAVLALTFLSTLAVAQRPAASSSATVDGVVSDTALVPLDNATVSIFGSDVRVVTGENGRFRITQLRPGNYIVFVRRVGFEMASATVQILPSDTTRVSFTLQPAATKLAPAIITARSVSPRMAEFEERREFAAKFGGGQFMSQDEIERRNTVFTTELIRTFRGIGVGYAVVVGSGKKRVPVVTSGRAAGSINLSCVPTVWLDGVLLPSPTDIDNLPSPKELAGIEVYPGPASVPPRYAAGGMSCGAVLIWTR